MPIGLPGFVENPEPRCPVILLCDTSGSMSGEPINALNTGLAAFQKDVYKDKIASLRVEVALVTFGSVRLTQDFVTIDEFSPPRLTADGVTPMKEAIEHALDLTELHDSHYAKEKENKTNSAWKPWNVFVCASTDGLERLAIRMSDWTPFTPFFQPLEQYLRETDNLEESDEYLLSFLNSERLNARTDDDKTLFLCLYRFLSGKRSPIS